MNRRVRLTDLLGTEHLAKGASQTLCLRRGEGFGPGRIEFITGIHRNQMNVNVRNGKALDGDADPLGRGHCA